MESNKTVLQKVISDTEGIFARIAENYPVLLSELESGITSAAESIRSLSVIKGMSDEKGKAVQLDDYLFSCKADSKQKLNAIDDFKIKNEDLLKDLSSAIDEYRNSQVYIEEIRDISESLQIVSLNALCNAVKAGKGGEGFSVITENLKDVTVNTIEKTENLESKGDLIKETLDQFYIVEKEINSKRSEILSVLEEEVLSGIDKFQSESEIVNRLLTELGSESGNIRSSILSIMEVLQQQDIIRQTLDQVILSINELPEGCGSCENLSEWAEADMDNAVFCVRLIDLSVIMIGEVVEILEETIRIFTGNFTTARNKLEYIQKEKDKAVQSFVENLESFGKLSKKSREIHHDSQVLGDKRQGLIKLIHIIIGNVGSMAEEFESFEKISGWLQNVAVLSRIELSRSLSLVGMRESVEDMSKLVNRIQEQIALGEKETGRFVTKTAGIFEDYKQYAEEEMGFLFDFTEGFSNNLTEISSINNTVSGLLSNFDFFTDDFYELFNISEKELDRLKEIAKDLSRVSGFLQGKENRIKPVLDEKMKGTTIMDWNISDGNMNRIIEKFTIYSHKKTAGELSGVGVENSVLEAGEVTLF